MDRFKQTLQKVPETPRPVFDNDSVAVLLDLCVHHNLPIPTYDPHLAFFTFHIRRILKNKLFYLNFRFELMQSGEPHSPIFTYVCQVSKIKRTGTFSTKKGAKQIAAREMLEAVRNCVQNNKEEKLTSTIDAEPPEKLFRAYRELRQLPVKSKAIRLRDRHNFFLHLPEADRREAIKILTDDSSVIYGTAKDRVYLACRALKLEYDVSDIPNHRQQFKAFYLLGDHDCVIAAKEEDLYNNIITHLKTMLDTHYF